MLKAQSSFNFFSTHDFYYFRGEFAKHSRAKPEKNKNMLVTLIITIVVLFLLRFFSRWSMINESIKLLYLILSVHEALFIDNSHCSFLLLLYFMDLRMEWLIEHWKMYTMNIMKIYSRIPTILYTLSSGSYFFFSLMTRQPWSAMFAFVTSKHIGAKKRRKGYKERC